MEPPLPRGMKSGRPPRWSRRQLVDGIRRRTRAGTPWRDAPERYGPVRRRRRRAPGHRRGPAAPARRV
ncbi:transposase [Streptomyces sp. NPDC048045]|uniref:transposase n=1 Tax=Streptomyces sp. NPDC048045 TaxID=3154710 RepID=UPI00341530E6